MSSSDTGAGEGVAERFAPSQVRAISLAVIAGTFLGGVGIGSALPILQTIDAVLGIGAAMLGIVLAANRFTRLVMNTPAGRIIDNRGVRKPMIVGLTIQGLAPFGYVVGLHTPRVILFTAPVLGDVSAPGAVFLLARMLWGIGSAFIFIGAFATVTHITTPANRGKWISYLRGSQSISNPIGFVVGGLVGDFFGIQTAFVVAGSLGVAGGIVAALLLPSIAPRTEPDDRARLREIPGMVRRQPVVLPIGFANFTLSLLIGGILLTTMVLYARATGIAVFSLQAAGMGSLLMAVSMLTATGSILLTGHVSDRLEDRGVVLVPALLFLAAGFATLAVVPTVELLFLGVFLIGIGDGAMSPTLLALLGDVTPGDELGRMGGVFNLMGDVGFTLGPLVAVPAVEVWFGYRSTYLACSALAVVVLAVVGATLLERKPWTGRPVDGLPGRRE